MSSLKVRNNRNPTDNEAVRVRQYIRAREREMESIISMIGEETSQVSTCREAIANLELAVPRGKEVIAMQEENLVALLAVQARLHKYKTISEPNAGSESHSHTLYNDLKHHFNRPIERGIPVMDREVERLKEEIRALWDTQRDSERELEGWRTSLALSEDAIQRLEKIKADLKDVLDTTHSLFRPVLRISADTWSMIFKLVHHEELMDHLQNGSTMPLRSTALILSQVCHSWHYQVHKEPDLWNNIAVHPSQYWSTAKFEHFASSVDKAGTPIKLVANLTQLLHWSYKNVLRYNIHTRNNCYQQTYQNHLGVEVAALTPDANELNGKVYSIHLDRGNHRSTCPYNTSYIPYRQPTQVAISSRSPLLNGTIHYMISIFPTLKSLAITNDHPQYLFDGNTINLLPNLTELGIYIKQPPANYQLPVELADKLEKLIFRSSTSVPPSIFPDVRFTKLHTLGIACRKARVIQEINAPILYSLLVYGCDRMEAVGLLQVPSSRIYKRLHEVTFVDWRRNEGEQTGYPQQLSLLIALAQRSPALASLCFQDSYVDGGVLVNLMSSRWHRLDKKPLNTIEKLTIDHTTGITRENCE